MGIEMRVTYFLQHSTFEKDNQRLFENPTPASPELEERTDTQWGFQRMAGKVGLVTHRLFSFNGQIGGKATRNT